MRLFLWPRWLHCIETLFCLQPWTHMCVCVNQIVKIMIYSGYQACFPAASLCSQRESSNFLMGGSLHPCRHAYGDVPSASDAWVCQTSYSYMKSCVNFILLFLQVVLQCCLKILNIHMWSSKWVTSVQTAMRGRMSPDECSAASYP